MVDSLSVDPTVLTSAGSKLSDLEFPQLPSPIVLSGADPVSAAIRSVVPQIEGGLVDRLSAVKSALMLTGSKLGAAASIYAETDQTVGGIFGQFAQQAITQGGQQLAVAASTAQGALASIQGAASGASAQVSAFMATPAGQFAMPMAMEGASEAAGVFPSLAQSMQGAMGGAASAGSPPAQLAADGAADTAASDQSTFVSQTQTDGDKQSSRGNGTSDPDAIDLAARLPTDPADPGTSSLVPNSVEVSL